MRFPVFIIGSPRSGTSITVDALLTAGYKGFREGSFLSVIALIDQAIERQFKVFDNGNPAVLISVIDKESFKSDLWKVAKQTMEQKNPISPWFDKTGNPEMIEIIPILRRLWPNCVFIFSKRRAIENVISRMKKFPGHSFAYHCKDWSRNMASWRAIRSELPTGTYTEIDQRDMIQHPDKVASKIKTLLDLDQEATRAISNVLIHNRPQQSDEGSAGRIVSLEGVEWPELSKAHFLEYCGAEMEASGYSLDETYFRDPS